MLRFGESRDEKVKMDAGWSWLITRHCGFSGDGDRLMEADRLQRIDAWTDVC